MHFGSGKFKATVLAKGKSQETQPRNSAEVSSFYPEHTPRNPAHFHDNGINPSASATLW